MILFRGEKLQLASIASVTNFPTPSDSARSERNIPTRELKHSTLNAITQRGYLLGHCVWGYRCFAWIDGLILHESVCISEWSCVGAQSTVSCSSAAKTGGYINKHSCIWNFPRAGGWCTKWQMLLRLNIDNVFMRARFSPIGKVHSSCAAVC